MTTCIRCQAPTNITVMSMFNTDIICSKCKAKEMAHPDFKKAMEAEHRAVRNGDFNFPGIGLPDDL